MRDDQEVNILGRLIFKLMSSPWIYLNALPLSQNNALIINYDYSTTTQNVKKLASL